MEKFVAVLFGVILGLFLIVGFSLVMAFPTMWCWNYVMPYLFGLKVITFWHALSLNILAGMLIKSSHTNNSK